MIKKMCICVSYVNGKENVRNGFFWCVQVTKITTEYGKNGKNSKKI
jgi:hypothetical protein